jgi:putative hydrolase of the HAD superfamily
LAGRYGYTPEDFYAHLYSGPEWAAARTGRLTSRDYWGQMQRKLGVPGELDQFLADLFAGEVINPAMVALTETLRRRFRIGLLSNALDDLESLLAERWRLEHLFDVVVNSARVGVAKPDPQAFELALAALERPAGEVLFVDDKLRNITAAEALGIPSIHYTDAPALLAELSRRDLITPDEYARLSAIG